MVGQGEKNQTEWQCQERSEDERAADAAEHDDDHQKYGREREILSDDRITLRHPAG